MNEKDFSVGSADFTYKSPTLRKTVKYAVSIYNEELSRLNFYFFNVNDDCLMDIEDPYSPFVITLYELNENNEITSNGSWKINYTYDNKHEITLQGRNIQPRYLNTENIDVEVNQHVPIPNELKLEIVQKNCPLSYNTKYYILFLTEMATGIKYLELLQTLTQPTRSSVLLKSRQKYHCQLYKVHRVNGQHTVTHETMRTTPIVTHNTQADVRDLKRLAERHLNRTGSSNANVIHLYRNKPINHPTIIKALETGMMEKYLKDNNGDPGLSINNKIKGLFFMATPKYTSGQIPDESFFGNYRIMVPPHYLVKDCHLYFADFTCLNGKSHYITLVLTKVDSEEDRYCQNRLVKLEFHDNPFFYRKFDRFFVPHRPYLHVEILYTENVNLLELQRLKKYGLDYKEFTLQSSLVKGRGQSTPGGIPKPTKCTVCNLSPILPIMIEK